MSLVKSVFTIGGYTFISRIFGFVRDVLIAGIMGANAMTDAFFVAFKLPNFMRRLFAEGAFNSAFVPLFSGTLVAEGKEKALQFAKEIKSVLVLILLILTLLAEIFMPSVVRVLAPGFSDDPEKFALTVALTRITFPYLFLISLVSLYGGMLNSVDKFAAVAATPIIMNLCLILSLVLLRFLTDTPAHALAIGVLLSGLAQWAWLAWFCKREGLLPGFMIPVFTDNVKKLFLLIGPAALGAGVAQINLMIDTIIATHIDDGVSYLYYADRISELPLGVIGIAVGTALLPLLSKLYREGKSDLARYKLNRAIELAMLLSLPAAAALMVMAHPIVTTLYERGAFDTHDTRNTYMALVAFAMGLPAFVLIKVFAPVFFANHNTKTPVKIASVCVLLNLVLNLVLMGPFSHVGLALATSIAGWVNAFLLGLNLYRLKLLTPDAALRSSLSKITLATGVMVAVLLGINALIADWFTASLFVKTSGLVIMVGGGLCVFGMAVLLMKVVSVKQLRGYLPGKFKK